MSRITDSTLLMVSRQLVKLKQVLSLLLAQVVKGVLAVFNIDVNEKGGEVVKGIDTTRRSAGNFPKQVSNTFNRDAQKKDDSTVDNAKFHLENEMKKAVQIGVKDNDIKDYIRKNYESLPDNFYELLKNFHAEKDVKTFYSDGQYKEIKAGLENGLSISQIAMYADYRMNNLQMKEVRLGLEERDPHIKDYANYQIPYEEMRDKRLSALEQMEEASKQEYDVFNITIDKDSAEAFENALTKSGYVFEKQETADVVVDDFGNTIRAVSILVHIQNKNPQDYINFLNLYKDFERDVSSHTYNSQSVDEISLKDKEIKAPEEQMLNSEDSPQKESSHLEVNERTEMDGSITQEERVIGDRC